MAVLLPNRVCGSDAAGGVHGGGGADWQQARWAIRHQVLAPGLDYYLVRATVDSVGGGGAEYGRYRMDRFVLDEGSGE